jgi:hypothetical protein
VLAKLLFAAEYFLRASVNAELLKLLKALPLDQTEIFRKPVDFLHNSFRFVLYTASRLPKHKIQIKEQKNVKKCIA